jgi:SNF2 family DNA or RNA helicase
MSIAKIYLASGGVFIQCPAFDSHRIKGVPQVKYDRKEKAYFCPKGKQVATHLLAMYDLEEFEPAALTAVESWSPTAINVGFPPTHQYKMPPRPYQLEAINKAFHKQSFALFMQMRTGKTYVAINLAAARYSTGSINAMLVICPTSAKPVWEMEMEKHCPIEYNIHLVQAGKKKPTEGFLLDKEGFRAMVVGVEALSAGAAYSYALEFCKSNKVMVVCDESITIKEAKSARTKRAWELADTCDYHLILNGTPVTQGVEDLWSQYRFLDWSIIQEKSFYNFKHKYCILGGFDAKKIIGYQNLPELMNKIAPSTFLITTEEAIGIPDLVYQTAHVDPSPAQKKALTTLGDPLCHMTASYGEYDLDIETVLERMIRYQQIVGGHFPYDIENSFGDHAVVAFKGKNPKLEEMISIIKKLVNGEKVIVWARFSPELDLIIKRLSEEFGDNSCTWYRGGMTDTERRASLERFSDDSNCRFFVANQVSGGRAIDLASASVHIYYSNSFSLDDRLQSEMRTNSSLQNAKSILIVDLIMNHGIDKAIVKALRDKKEVADCVQGMLKDRR